MSDNRPDASTPEYLGPCGAELDLTYPLTGAPGEQECEGDIYAPRGGSVGRCRNCGAAVVYAPGMSALTDEEYAALSRPPGATRTADQA